MTEIVQLLGGAGLLGIASLLIPLGIIIPRKTVDALLKSKDETIAAQQVMIEQLTEVVGPVNKLLKVLNEAAEKETQK